MDIIAAESLPAGAAIQLTALATVLGGVLLVAGLLLLWQWLRLSPEVDQPGEAVDQPGEAVDLPGEAGLPPAARATDDLPAVTRLLAGALIALLVLPTAVVVRQLWPLPDLGQRVLGGWLLVVVSVVLAWTALAIAAGNKRRRRR